MQILEKIFRMFFLPVSFLELKLFLVDLKITQRYQSLCSLLGQNTPQMHLLEGRSCPCLMCHRHDGRSRQGEDKSHLMPFIQPRTPVHGIIWPIFWVGLPKRHLTGTLRALSLSPVRLTRTTATHAENLTEKISNNRLYFNKQTNLPSRSPCGWLPFPVF